MKLIYLNSLVAILLSVNLLAQNPIFKVGQKITAKHDTKVTNTVGKTQNTNIIESLYEVLSQSDTNHLFSASFTRFFGTVSIAGNNVANYDTDKSEDNDGGYGKIFQQFLNTPIQVSLNKKTGKASILNLGNMDVSSTVALQMKVSIWVSGFITDIESMVIDKRYKLNPGLKWNETTTSNTMGTLTTNTTLTVLKVVNGTATIQTTSRIKGESTTNSEWDPQKQIIMEMSGTGKGEIIVNAITNFVSKITKTETIKIIFNSDGGNKNNITENVSITSFSLN